MLNTTKTATTIITFITAAMAMGLGCIGEPLEDGEQVDYAEGFAVAPTEVSVPCGKSESIYTNATSDDRCISVQVTQECDGNTKPQVANGRGNRYPLGDEPIDIEIKAGNSATGHCNGFLAEKGCCKFEIGPAIGTCESDDDADVVEEAEYDLEF